MPAPTFVLAKDPKKHFVRTRLWLPFCRAQFERVRLRGGNVRPLRYLTFCGEDAIDVLMLSEEGILEAPRGEYPDVCFAALRDELVNETLRAIPGARGFAGDFFETVLFDPKDHAPLHEIAEADDADDAFYEALRTASDTPAGRAKLTIARLKDELTTQFPFDVINLDLCDYTFKNKEDIPGRKIKALRRILAWQREPRTENGRKYEIKDFSLLYTTRIDVLERLDGQYEGLLDNGIDSNVGSYGDVKAALRNRVAVDSAAALRRRDRREYLRLGISKQLAMTVSAEGWEIDSDHGMPGFGIERVKRHRHYTMLHVAMHLRRIEPKPKTRAARVSRARGSAYHQTIHQLFSTGLSTVPRLVPNDVAADLARLEKKSERDRGRTV